MQKTILTLTAICVAVFAADGKTIYDSQCKSCHGADGKTKALGKSAPLVGLSADAVAKDLEGYKAGTVNKNGMGGVMKGNAVKLSADDIKAVSAYITTFK